MFGFEGIKVILRKVARGNHPLKGYDGNKLSSNGILYEITFLFGNAPFHFQILFQHLCLKTNDIINSCVRLSECCCCCRCCCGCCKILATRGIGLFVSLRSCGQHCLQSSCYHHEWSLHLKIGHNNNFPIT